MTSKKPDKDNQYPSSNPQDTKRAFFLIEIPPHEKLTIKHKGLGDSEIDTYLKTPHSKLREVWQEAGWINPGDVGRLLGLSIGELSAITKGSKRFESDEEYERACKLIRETNPNPHTHRKTEGNAP